MFTEDQSEEAGLIQQAVEKMLALRSQAKRDIQRYEDELQRFGIEIEDFDSGTRWQITSP